MHFNTSIDKQSLFETSNSLTEGVTNFPGNVFTSRVVNQYQNGKQLHSATVPPRPPPPMLIPSPEIRNRSHLSSLSNKPLIINTTTTTSSCGYRSGGLFPSPLFILPKPTVNNELGKSRPNVSRQSVLCSLITGSNNSNTRNDNSLISQNETLTSTAVTSQRECMVRNDTVNEFPLRHLTTSVSSSLNCVPTTTIQSVVFSPNPTHSSELHLPHLLNPESLKSAIANRTFCFVSSSKVNQPPALCVQSTPVAQKVQPTIANSAIARREETAPSPLVQLFESCGSVIQGVGGIVNVFVNGTGLVHNSCSTSNGIGNANEGGQQSEPSTTKNSFICPNCPFTSSTVDRLSRHIHSRHLFQSIIPHPQSVSSPNVSNQMVVSALPLSVNNISSSNSVGVIRLPTLNPFDLTSQPSGNHQIHNDNGISEFSIPLSLNLPPNDVTTTASVRQPTSNNSSDTTTSQQSHRRKQAFPVSMPIGSEEIQLPVTISNRPFSNPPSGSVSPEKTVVNTLARESSNSSYVSASTLDDDTGDETDLVFLGFTQVAVSRKRLHHSENDEKNPIKTSVDTQKPPKRRKPDSGISPHVKRSRKKVKQSSANESSALTTPHPLALPDVSVNIERLTDIPSVSSTDSSDASVITIDSSESENSDHEDRNTVLDGKNNSPETFSQRIELTNVYSSPVTMNSQPLEQSFPNERSKSPDERESPVDLNFLSTNEPLRTVNTPPNTPKRSDSFEEITTSNNHNKSVKIVEEKPEQLKDHDELPIVHSSPVSANILPMDISDSNKQHTTASKTNTKPSKSKKKPKEIKIPDEFLVPYSRSIMDADDIQVDITTGEVFIKNTPLRSLVMGLKRPLDIKKPRTLPQGGRNQPSRKSKVQQPSSSNTKDSLSVVVNETTGALEVVHKPIKAPSKKKKKNSNQQKEGNSNSKVT
uniref:Uncharacterized protein n=1 Tax=Trichobilharzia regenti TaxID=157069 RepID=A0AA85K625_TRIRE|nr:unnamed protein product [Trichobilharzia regenti]